MKPMTTCHSVGHDCGPSKRDTAVNAVHILQHAEQLHEMMAGNSLGSQR